jgi:hypothetical protein
MDGGHAWGDVVRFERDAWAVSGARVRWIAGGLALSRIFVVLHNPAVTVARRKRKKQIAIGVRILGGRARLSAVYAERKACAGEAAQAVRAARRLFSQRLRAGLDCGAPMALERGEIGNLRLEMKAHERTRDSISDRTRVLHSF